MMADRLDDILKQALTPVDKPAKELNRRLMCRMEEENIMSEEKKDWKTKQLEGRKHWEYGSRRIPAAALVAALVLGVGSVSALAAAKLLMPSQVTQIMGDEKLTGVFDKGGGIYVGETQSLGGYDVTFLGIASGKNISDFDFFADGELRDDRSYTVVSIANSDGTPMPKGSSDEYDMGDFFVTPLVQGCDPVWFNGPVFAEAAKEMVVDGVRYRLTECDNVEMFADRELYLAVMDSTFYNNDAYVYDVSSGKITQNGNYHGLNALFRLPVDVSKADPTAAKVYLEKLEKELFPDKAAGVYGTSGGNDSFQAAGTDGSASIAEADGKMDEEAEFQAQMKEIWGDRYEEWKSTDDWYRRLTPENLDEYAVPVESTRQILKPDANGYISDWDYEVEGRGGGEGGRTKVEWLFKNVSSEHPTVLSCSHSGTMESMLVQTYTLNEDGTVTFVAYIPKGE